MTRLLNLSISVTCLDCRTELVRTEADAGDHIELPNHKCEVSP